MNIYKRSKVIKRIVSDKVIETHAEHQLKFCRTFDPSCSQASNPHIDDTGLWNVPKKLSSHTVLLPEHPLVFLKAMCQALRYYLPCLFLPSMFGFHPRTNKVLFRRSFFSSMKATTTITSDQTIVQQQKKMKQQVCSGKARKLHFYRKHENSVHTLNLLQVGCKSV
jgi:hypothetical protein